MKINVITLGCAKNLVDSENLLGELKAAGITVMHDSYDLSEDITIINTCGFINDAKQESINTILSFAEARTKGEIEKLYVIGCLSERYKEDLEKEIPEVDEYFGTKGYMEILHELKVKSLYNKHHREITTPRHYAYMKISEGCDRKCSFCAIPLIRGKHISIPIDNLVAEAKQLSTDGVKELILVAQDLNYYGVDLEKKPILNQLLKELCKVDGIEWIRLQYTYPVNFNDELIELIATEPKICKYVDIPLQHCSDKMLKIMQRGYSKQTMTGFIEKLRRKVPGIAIRTTMLVGHPGETRKEFEELLEYIREMRFERLGVFSYSHEENTHSYLNYKDSVPMKEKNTRVDEIMSVQQEISFSLNVDRVGQVVNVIIDSEEEKNYIGRTMYDSPEVDNEVIIAKNRSQKLQVGSFYNVKITEAGEFELFGETAQI